MTLALRELLLAIASFGCFIFFLYSIPPPTEKSYGSYLTRKLRNVQMSTNYTCVVPELDPWDPSIQKYMQNLSELECSRTQYDLTYLSSNGTLSIDLKEVSKLGFDVDCSYRCFEKVEGDDIALKYDKWTSFKDSTETTCEFLEVRCKRSNFPYSKIYSNNHNRIIPLETKKSEKWKPSVILFVMDSVSHSHWQRSLPKTFKVLKETYKSFVFNGMTKVGDNSFPNAYAFLAGTSVDPDLKTGFFDDHPLIWKDFKEKGYRTYYAEDYPKFNLFSYLAKGFKSKPVDHYFRHFWLNVYDSYLHRRSTNLCYGNTPMHKIQLNYFNQFVQKYKDVPTFGMNWLTELGHDYMNQVQFGDSDVANVLNENYEVLKDSFVFVLSDHGHRFDAIRQTEIGKMEENIPFFSMHIPERLKGNFRKTVEENTKTLTSFWDFHETLHDILNLSESGDWKELDNSIEHNSESKGLSLLRPIKNRSCREASIPDEYCTCKTGETVPVSTEEASLLASSLVSHVNSLLSSHTKCASLSLSKVLYASRLEYSDEGEQFQVSVEVAPSGATFEALLRKNNNEYSVVSEVNRTNRYGNQSECVNNANLRKFCFCEAQ